MSALPTWLASVRGTLSWAGCWYPRGCTWLHRTVGTDDCLETGRSAATRPSPPVPSPSRPRPRPSRPLPRTLWVHVDKRSRAPCGGPGHVKGPTYNVEVTLLALSLGGNFRGGVKGTLNCQPYIANVPFRFRALTGSGGPPSHPHETGSSAGVTSPEHPVPTATDTRPAPQSPMGPKAPDPLRRGVGVPPFTGTGESLGPRGT